MIDEHIKDAILHSLKSPVMFCDLDHIIRYMNAAAMAHYKTGEALLGSNVLNCHNEASQKMLLQIFQQMKNGLQERLITDNEKCRIYMRAVRDKHGTLIGYYERYDPPANV